MTKRYFFNALTTYRKPLTCSALALGLVACGSGGGGDNMANKSDASTIGPITAGNFGAYITQAITTWPIKDVEGFPVGESKFDDVKLNTEPDMAGTIIQLCEDGSGELTVVSLIQGASPKVITAGDYNRKDYNACPLSMFTHNGSIEASIEQYTQYPFDPETSLDPFVALDAKITTTYSGYSAQHISNDDKINIDGTLTVTTQIQSTQDFLDAEQRIQTLKALTTTDFYSLQASNAELSINQTFTNFSHDTSDTALLLNGQASTTVSGTTYDYTVAMPEPLEVTVIDERKTYKGEMQIMAGLSTLRVRFNGTLPADITLDTDNDGQVDYRDSFSL